MKLKKTKPFKGIMLGSFKSISTHGNKAKTYIELCNPEDYFIVNTRRIFLVDKDDVDCNDFCIKAFKNMRLIEIKDSYKLDSFFNIYNIIQIFLKKYKITDIVELKNFFDTLK